MYYSTKVSSSFVDKTANKSSSTNNTTFIFSNDELEIDNLISEINEREKKIMELKSKINNTIINNDEISKVKEKKNLYLNLINEKKNSLLKIQQKYENFKSKKNEEKKEKEKIIAKLKSENNNKNNIENNKNLIENKINQIKNLLLMSKEEKNKIKNEVINLISIKESYEEFLKNFSQNNLLNIYYDEIIYIYEINQFDFNNLGKEFYENIILTKINKNLLKNEFIIFWTKNFKDYCKKKINFEKLIKNLNNFTKFDINDLLFIFFKLKIIENEINLNINFLNKDYKMNKKNLKYKLEIYLNKFEKLNNNSLLFIQNEIDIKNNNILINDLEKMLNQINNELNKEFDLFNKEKNKINFEIENLKYKIENENNKENNYNNNFYFEEDNKKINLKINILKNEIETNVENIKKILEKVKNLNPQKYNYLITKINSFLKVTYYKPFFDFERKSKTYFRNLKTYDYYNVYNQTDFSYNINNKCKSNQIKSKSYSDIFNTQNKENLNSSNLNNNNNIENNKNELLLDFKNDINKIEIPYQYKSNNLNFINYTNNDPVKRNLMRNFSKENVKKYKFHFLYNNDFNNKNKKEKRKLKYCLSQEKITNSKFNYYNNFIKNNNNNNNYNNDLNFLPNKVLILINKEKTFCYIRINNKEKKFLPWKNNKDFSDFLEAHIKLNINKSIIEIYFSDNKNKIEININDIENTVINAKMKKLIEIHRLFRKYLINNSNDNINLNNFIDINDLNCNNKEFIKKCCSNQFFNFDINLNNIPFLQKIEIIFCNYDDFKKWINCLSFLINNKSIFI